MSNQISALHQNMYSSGQAPVVGDIVRFSGWWIFWWLTDGAHHGFSQNGNHPTSC